MAAGRLALLQHEWQRELAAAAAKVSLSEKAFVETLEPLGALQIAALSSCLPVLGAAAAAGERPTASAAAAAAEEAAFAAAAVARHMRALGSAARDCGAIRHSRHWLLLAEETLQKQLLVLQQEQQQQQQLLRSLLCCDLFVIEWEIARTLHAAGDTHRAIHLGRRLCRSGAWPFSLKQLLQMHPKAAAAAAAPAAAADVEGASGRGGWVPVSPFAAATAAGGGGGAAAAAGAAAFAIRRAEFLESLCGCLCSCAEWLHLGRFIGETEARKGFFSLAIAVSPCISSISPQQRLAQMLDDALETFPSDQQQEELLLLQQHQEQQQLQQLQQQQQQRRRRLAADAVSLYVHCLRDSCLPHAARTTGRLLSLWFSFGPSVPQINLSIRRALAAGDVPPAAAAAAPAAAIPAAGSPFAAAAAAAAPMALRLRRSADLRHLLPFVPQIVSRLAVETPHQQQQQQQQQQGEAAFQLSLREVLTALARQAPFTVLLPLIAMERNDRIPAAAAAAAGASRAAATTTAAAGNSSSSNAKAAGCLLRQLAAADPSLNEAVRAATAMASLYEDICLLKETDQLLQHQPQQQLQHQQQQQQQAPLSRRAGRRGAAAAAAPAAAAPAAPAAAVGVSSADLLAYVRCLPSYRSVVSLVETAAVPLPSVAARLEALSPVSFLQQQQQQQQQQRDRLSPFAAAGEGCLRSYAEAHLECLSLNGDGEICLSLSFLGTGVTRPKVIDAVSLRGLSYREVCKQDDLRRDRVAQQLFSLLNEAFAAAAAAAAADTSAAAAAGDLRLRTYAVIPLSPFCGVLEWVRDAITMGEYLIGAAATATGDTAAAAAAAHRRYRPQDWTAQYCRKRMTDARAAATREAALQQQQQQQQRQQQQQQQQQQQGQQQQQDAAAAAAAAAAARDVLHQRLLETYEEICLHFRPVLSHFFLESSPASSLWFSRRLCYRRSLAAASIVGFVVGLGDRHLNNILLDKETGGFLHIDFGVMFDMGSLLPIPETVPFRLTRDILDGLGCLGVEGPFFEDCCVTLQLLREHTPLVSSVLEVLLLDPLYSWRGSAKTQQQQQQHIRGKETDRCYKP